MNTSRKRMNKKWRIWAVVALLAIGSMIAALIWKTTSPKYALSMLTVETAEDDEEILNVIWIKRRVRKFFLSHVRHRIRQLSMTR